MLSPPPLENPYSSDPSFRRVLTWYLSRVTLQDVEPKFTQFAAQSVSDRVHDLISNPETQLPSVETNVLLTGSSFVMAERNWANKGANNG